MRITDLLSLLGGLALFLYGMRMMSDGLENAAGDKMKGILQKLTANRYLGVFVGALITAIIQSSSATTVMVVGFVNSKMMTLTQAVWIIMGANIGTTITGQLIALDIGALAPLFAFVGVIMIVFLKKDKLQHFGLIISGLGILFIGMEMMSQAMTPLQNSSHFIQLMTSFSNPFIGILAGALFTALIQSSSASVGILQTLAQNGLISFNSAVFVLFGQNIGTCITAILASISTGTNAKRTTIIHLLFNFIGTILFTVLCLVFPLADAIVLITPSAPASQIANMHTLFNIVTTLLLLPFGEQLARLSMTILKDKRHQKRSLLQCHQNIGLGHMMMDDDILSRSTCDMLKLVKSNVYDGFLSLINDNLKLNHKIEKYELMINQNNQQIITFISKSLSHTYNHTGVKNREKYLEISSNIERIGDHGKNLIRYQDILTKENIKLSQESINEIKNMQSLINEAITCLYETKEKDENFVSKIASYEQQIDDMTYLYRLNNIKRMTNGECFGETCALFGEMLVDFERIGDHILNIAQAYWEINK